MQRPERDTAPPAGPRLDDDTVLADSAEPPADEATWVERRIGGAQGERSRARAPAFERCRFARASLCDSNWERARLLDVELAHVDAANARWLEASWRRVAVRAGRWTGFDGSDGRYEDVRFSDCRMDYALLQRARFRRVRFERCDLTSAELAGADLRGVALRDCTLTHANVAGARLVGCDLRGSRLDGLVAGPGDLRGAIVSVGQLPEVAGLFGVDVRP